MAARFFCDNCGATVDRKTDRCPKCGCFFENVRCPKCGFTGEEELFSKGCPSCGYFSKKNAPGKTQKKSAIGSNVSKAAMPSIHSMAKLPLWVYVLALLGLLLVTLMLLFFV